MKALVTKTSYLSDIINLRATEVCEEGKGLKLGQKYDTIFDTQKMKKNRKAFTEIKNRKS